MRYLFVGGPLDGETKFVVPHLGNHTPPQTYNAEWKRDTELVYYHAYDRVEIGTGEWIYAAYGLTSAEVRRKLHENYMPHVAGELAAALKPIIDKLLCVRLADMTLGVAIQLRGIHEALSDLLRKYKP